MIGKDVVYRGCPRFDADSIKFCRPNTSVQVLFLLQANAEQAHKPFDFGLLNVYDFS
jgi:hypothetical protein